MQYMHVKTYDLMKHNVEYNASCSVGGRCIVQKTVSDVPKGTLTCKFPNGKTVTRHYTFFDLYDEVDK